MPRVFLRPRADGLLWLRLFCCSCCACICMADEISGCCCQLHYLGPIISGEVLPMPRDGPNALAATAASVITYVQLLFSCRHFQCPWVDPLHLMLLLPIASLGPIIF